MRPGLRRRALFCMRHRKTDRKWKTEGREGKGGGGAGGKRGPGGARMGSVKCATLMKCHDSPARCPPPTPARCHRDKEDAAATSAELSLPWRKV